MNIINRIYEDYFKMDRLPYYREMLQYAREHGYIMAGILDFYKMMQNIEAEPNKRKIIVNRHDIDTSPKVAREMFRIEKSVYEKMEVQPIILEIQPLTRHLSRKLKHMVMKPDIIMKRLPIMKSDIKLRTE